ncbi:hypothetical protein [Glaciimonas sp. PAMC28666]|uniref:hypothetical protein n=1 Tax=Glaciimonas sp. PAMC28666 TaxID=2807626 RepID=UPI0019649B77|nr:hypothetical protein [Glaciimonas sp. PAMC28666]QRX83256.1 hypothetical protein JQN73_02975 [Glaciimonas sp. PAMC28666]
MEHSESPAIKQKEFPTFNKTRAMNWVIAGFLACAFVPMLIRARVVTPSTLMVYFLTAIVGICIPAMTAMALSRDGVSLMGMPVYIPLGIRTASRKPLLVTNALIGLIGLAPCGMILATGQYFALISMTIFIIPPIINFMMLRRAIRSA